MNLVSIIVPNQSDRLALRSALSGEWKLLEAADGLSGLDLVRRHRQELSLVVLDTQLPDIDGVTTILRIRALRPDIPIIPYVDQLAVAPALRALGCNEPLTRPLQANDVVSVLHAAIGQPALPRDDQTVAAIALEQSVVIEHLLRQQQTTVHTLVYAASHVRRIGLVQLLSSTAAVTEAIDRRVLALLLRHRRWTAIVADASTYADVSDLVHEAALPLILVASDELQAQVVQTPDVACVLIETDPAIANRLRATLQAIAHGMPIDQSDVPPAGGARTHQQAPPWAMRCLADLSLSPREIDVLWCDYQGLSPSLAAEALSIYTATVSSHWKRIRTKLRATRPQIRTLVRERLQAARARTVGSPFAGDAGLDAPATTTHSPQSRSQRAAREGAR